MFRIDKEDKTIHITRGDIASFDFSITKKDETPYTFVYGDVVRISVTTKNEEKEVKLQKDFVIEEESETVTIELNSEDTKIDDIINKYKDYWYEIVLNPDTQPQTVIGWDLDGAKLFRLYPEAGDFVEEEI